MYLDYPNDLTYYGHCYNEDLHKYRGPRRGQYFGANKLSFIYFLIHYIEQARN
jgi:hypothetical protein